MLILYRLTLGIYWLIIRMISPFHEKAKKFIDGRRAWRIKLKNAFGGNSDPVIWVHAASLGEFEQGRPVIEQMKTEDPNLKILLTFFSPSGYEIRKNYQGADWVFYLPIDTPGNARNFVTIVNPKMAVFIKYEYWYCYLRELHRNQIPTLFVSAIFRENQLFFHPLGSFYRKALKWVTHYFVQDEKSLELIKGVGVKDAEITGDTRFDRVITILKESKNLPILEKFTGSEKAIVVGSAWSSDLDVIEPFIKNHLNKFKFIIAPHNINEAEIESIMNRFESIIKYSSNEADLVSNRVLIIDNMGMLSSVYNYGDFAIIGGAFRGALHNTLEAAVYGIPVLFGEHPNNEKFKEAIALIQTGGGFTFSNSNELEQIFDVLNSDAYQKVSMASRDFVYSNSGATDKVVRKIFMYL